MPYSDVDLTGLTKGMDDKTRQSYTFDNKQDYQALLAAFGTCRGKVVGNTTAWQELGFQASLTRFDVMCLAHI